ncbi:hypothetical protein J416_14987 [Gracilibacillus halophilus YIM-C55.5]|uniref:Uncharacterized protein n=1 Tax=Gracilibacillus halophilus YIM-C55.5 TaxID=1308866 RepID=N4WHI8_9BACI|nr:hypothetical protein [Gracilibacillus halophilus]ENH95647.1 hypothetical protein J416_14987 [Gracilibacillus halophilus YIM-C55.5]
MRYLNEHEWKIASRFLFLSMALRVIKLDLHQLSQSTPFKINEPYINLLKKMEANATEERKHLRKQMREEQLQVLLDEKNESFTSYLFVCKGKEEKRNYFNPAIRQKVASIIEDLMKQADRTTEPLMYK